MPNRFVHLGEFDTDKFNGQGTFTSFDGSIYVGTGRNGKPYGKGVMTIGEIRVEYSGDFIEGEFHGEGEVTLPDRRKYVGEFHAGDLHGGGVEFSMNGTVSKRGKLADGRHQFALSKIWGDTT